MRRRSERLARGWRENETQGHRKTGSAEEGTLEEGNGEAKDREPGTGSREPDGAGGQRPTSRPRGESVGRRAAARVQDLATRQDLQTLIGGRSEGGAEASR